jgi:outer membrane receptor protein involved in Fe transport
MIPAQPRTRLLRALPFAVLLPAAFGQAETLDPITVSATRAPEPQSQVPFTVEEVPQSAFDQGVALTVDDALRETPDFSLFRRNDSMTANPTSQGVSLRGLGPSGASRSLVLLDGIPLNDPFGGWVPWSLVPSGSLAGAEIVPGGGAAAWGNEALAGVIQLFSREPAAGTGYASARLGDFDTRAAEFEQAVALGGGVLELGGGVFATDGVVLVAPGQRGPIDIDAASRHVSGEARWRGALGRAARAVVTLRSFDEWRDNGTPYQQNRLHQRLGSVALSGGANPDETWNLTGYLQDQSASQTFSSVSASRTSETPASNQFSVPAIALGAAASSSWAGSSGSVTTLGADLRDIRGETREDYLYANGAFTDQRFAGGRQTFAGLFAERTQPLVAGLHAYAGVRLDRWEDSDGHLRTSVISTGAPLSGSAYPTQTGDVFSPSAGLVWRAAPGLELHVAAQRAFRQPTLNELYRPFQQGSTVTLANPGLSTEHADTAEAGADWRRGRVRLSLVGFVARLEDPVTNVTIAVGPGTFPGFGKLPAGGVGQERLNLGRIDTQGVQLGASWRESAALSVDFSVLGENATIASAPGQAALVGNDVPEVPRWNAALSVTWRPLGRIRLSLRARRTGQDYDDTQNLLPLAAATEIDVSMELELARHVRAFATVDNLADSMIETAHSATGVFNIAPPRTSNAGVRLDW